MLNFTKFFWKFALLMGVCFSLVMCKNIATSEHREPPAETIVEEIEEPPSFEKRLLSWSKQDFADYCAKVLKALPGKYNNKEVISACQEIKRLPGCHSLDGKPIMHYDRVSKHRKKRKNKGIKRILTLSLIHGDEVPSGSVARSWMERLDSLNPRNSWRVIPIVNPDGLKLRTRMNANKVDLNRNFPTLDWDEQALHHWRVDKKADPRRYPGPKGGSEIETQCLLKHLADFKPDFIISIHTPLGVLDFDGPKKIRFPRFRPLPWLSLGNFPGSLGRYMWTDRNVPVLTIELNGQKGVNRLAEFDRLQDISGTVAIQASKVKKKRKVKNDRFGRQSKSKEKDRS